MMVESLLQTGAFREAAEFAADAKRARPASGDRLLGLGARDAPRLLPGRVGLVLESVAEFREEWTAAGKPPLAAMAAALASAGAIHGYRGDEAAAEEWFAFGEQVAPDIEGQIHGITIWRADVDLHHGRISAAAERSRRPRPRASGGGPSITPPGPRPSPAPGIPETEEAIALGREFVGENPYAQALLERAEGIHRGDEALLRASLQRFEEIDCPYQAARSGWLIGGEERERASAVFERLGAVEPAG